MRKKYLCMDFDGVFVDSTNECVKVAVAAYKKIFGKNKFRTEEIEKLKVIRPMVKGAQEYLFAIHLLLESKKNIKHIDLDIKNFKKYYSKKIMDLYTYEFYQVRENLIKKNIDAWIKSHYFFEDAFKILNDWNNNKSVEFSIISLKDKDSISLLLKEKGFIDITIIDKSSISNKPEGLYRISSEKNIDKQDILFIDDNPLHLKSCLDEGFKNVFLPKWNKICSNYSKTFPEIELISKESVNKILAN